jgi:hypothetical protein
MRNPFSRRRQASSGRANLLEALSRRKGAYTVEMPDEGAGHYVYDPSDSCSVHSHRLEAWCNVEDMATARDELHWHCMMLSQLGIGAEPIRQMAHQLIESRQQKLGADQEALLEGEMAKKEGTVKSAPALSSGEREEREQAEERERDLRKEADQEGTKLDGLRERFDRLPRRARVPISRPLVFTVSISFTIFDVGVLGNAFELIPGDVVWKIILTIGVALAPLSTAIGIAQWLSAAELPIREGIKATRLAMVAGFLCIIGIGLIVLFRMAASGTPPLPWNAYLFLAFIQSALAMAETMLYTVYFDSKVGHALQERIAAAEDQVEAIDSRAIAEHRRATSAQAKIGTIEKQAAEAHAELDRAEPERTKINAAVAGEAGVLKGIVESAILEGVVAAQRAEERKRREKEEGEEEGFHPGFAWGGATLLAITIFTLGIAASSINL